MKYFEKNKNATKNGINFEPKYSNQEILNIDKDIENPLRKDTLQLLFEISEKCGELIKKETLNRGLTICDEIDD